MMINVRLGRKNSYINQKLLNASKKQELWSICIISTVTNIPHIIDFAWAFLKQCTKLIPSTTLKKSSHLQH